MNTSIKGRPKIDTLRQKLSIFLERLIIISKLLLNYCFSFQLLSASNWIPIKNNLTRKFLTYLDSATYLHYKYSFFERFKYILTHLIVPDG